MKVELSVNSIIEALHNAKQINDETYFKIIKELKKGENNRD